MDIESENSSMIYSLKHIFCKNPECTACSQGKGHGPFWHAIFKINGKEQTVFLGREFKTLDPAENPVKSPRKKVPDISTKKNNTTINSFQAPSDKHSNLIDHIDVRQIPPKNTKSYNKQAVLPPSQQEFERDLGILKNSSRFGNLKTVYRNLIKKYHPDNYPNEHQVSAWMAEINSHYQCRTKTGSI